MRDLPDSEGPCASQGLLQHLGSVAGLGGISTVTALARSKPTLGALGRGHGFGTLPVFLAGISTILGAIMFLRFGYAVGSVGLLGALGIIVLGHAVTFPTALAIAEIATNRKVEGGGEYFIISRSFGTTIGGVIGIFLYLSQAISVAFYLIAFAEAFSPVASWFAVVTGVAFDPRYVSIPALLGLLTIVTYRGAAMGVKMLYVVAAVLLTSLVLFFLGAPLEGFDPATVRFTGGIVEGDAFIVVFAIVFPAFTGMTAGVGLSGDLKDPRVSLPNGTLLATCVGVAVYVLIVFKLAYSAPMDALVEEQLIMAKIALWGPVIFIGLGCATLSSAIGSILVAPRTLQALGADSTTPTSAANEWLARGYGKENEPRHATVVTGMIALAIVMVGNVDMVARIISMFFMVTYGALCAIGVLEHFAARPSYRPSFRSRWYVSLIGALTCLFLMFQMDPVYAFAALVLMAGMYKLLERTQSGESDLAAMFEGVMTQATRTMHVRLQRRRRVETADEWRPSIIMVNDRTFDRRSPLAMLRWLCHRHGFGTYLHFIQDRLNARSFRASEAMHARLIELARMQKSTVYMDTIVSPSMMSALAQSLQVPGVSGISNNAVMFEFSKRDDISIVEEVVQLCTFSAATDKTLLVLRHGDYHFGERQRIHIWLTWNDAANANMMILLGYILVGHPDWEGASIEVFAALPQAQLEERRREFKKLIAEGRLPISEKNLRYIPTNDETSFRKLVATRSEFADLMVVGFDLHGINERGVDVFTNHSSPKDVLFVHAPERIAME